jgi:HlyD family secretion protein
MSEQADPVSRKNTKKKRLWLPVLLLAMVAGAAAVILPRESAEPKSVDVASVPDAPLGVGARGRIEPEDGVLRVAAPYAGGSPPIIDQLRVKETDWVKAGQVIAVIRGLALLEKNLRQSEAEIEVARMRLAQVKAGAKSADLDEQRMEIARWESEYEIASTDYRRYRKLRETEDVSAADLDQKRLVMERARRTLEAARERLKSLEEIRKEDVDVHVAELAAATAKAEANRVEIERMIVRAPVDGRVVGINAYAGEEAGAQGILELARTDRMYVIAEVYESDISRVRLGQKASVSGELVPEKLQGVVTQIGSQVTKSNLLPTDTASFADTRVIQVKIQLENGERVAGLIDGKVDVVIHP